MGCCHADFAMVEGSDRGFTLGMPTFTFGPGVLAEAGDNAVELGLKRVALFTDRKLASGEHVAKVKASLAAAKVDAIVFDEVAIEPTDTVAAGGGEVRARSERRRLRVRRRRLGDGHVQGGKPLRDAPGGVHDVRERADRRGSDVRRGR